MHKWQCFKCCVVWPNVASRYTCLLYGKTQKTNTVWGLFMIQCSRNPDHAIYKFRNPASNLFNSACHGCNSTSLCTGGTDTGQELGHRDADLGTTLLQEKTYMTIKSRSVRHATCDKAPLINTTKPTIEKMCTVLSRMTSLGRDSTPLTEHHR